MIAVAVVAQCSKGSSGTPTPPPSSPTAPTASCANFAGSWAVAHVDQCGTRTDATITVTQAGCVASFQLPGVGSGALNLDVARRATITRTDGCGNLPLAGTADDLNTSRLRIVYGEGPDGCCRHGSFLLTR